MPILRFDDQRALIPWLRYYVLTESFDRSLPGGWSRYDRDSWAPSGEAIGTSRTYAHDCLRRCQADAWHAGVSDAEMRSAKQAVLRIAHVERCTLLERLDGKAAPTLPGLSVCRASEKDQEKVTAVGNLYLVRIP